MSASSKNTKLTKTKEHVKSDKSHVNRKHIRLLRKKTVKKLGLGQVFGYEENQTFRRGRRLNDYAMGFRERTKVKLLYGIRTHHIKKYKKIAQRLSGGNTSVANDIIVSLCEMRLQTLLWRSGLAATVSASRQIISHGHVLVNGKKMDRKSYQVKVGDKVSLKSNVQENTHYRKWANRMNTVNHIKRTGFEIDILNTPTYNSMQKMLPINFKTVLTARLRA